MGREYRYNPKNKGNVVEIVEVTEQESKHIQNPTKVKAVPIKRERLFVILALVLVVSIVIGTLYGAFKAASYVTYDDLTDFTDETGVITDRFGKEIYTNGKVKDYSAYGNLVGYKEYMHNTLLYRFSDMLRPGSVNPIFGYRMIEKQPRVMKTTLLSNESQQVLVDMFGSASGCCFAYNYETGEVYTALSFPAYVPNKSNAECINRCFESLYIPGSTMKMITASLAVDQGKDVAKLQYTCNKEYKLSNGNTIVCTGNHGKIGFSSAIGQSCNCYFAQLIQDLNLEKALASLRKMGFSVNGSETADEVIDKLNKSTSAVDMTDTSSFKNVWGLIGQGNSQVNPIDMARFAAAIVNEGEAAQPYVVQSVVNPNKKKSEIFTAETEKVRILSKSTAKKTAKFWKEGVDKYYYTRQGMSKKIDYAKTGTAQRENATSDKLLMGVIKSAKTAFYIVVEKGKGPKPVEIANKLVELLPSNG